MGDDLYVDDDSFHLHNFNCTVTELFPDQLHNLEFRFKGRDSDHRLVAAALNRIVHRRKLLP